MPSTIPRTHNFEVGTTSYLHFINEESEQRKHDQVTQLEGGKTRSLNPNIVASECVRLIISLYYLTMPDMENVYRKHRNMANGTHADISALS